MGNKGEIIVYSLILVTLLFCCWRFLAHAIVFILKGKTTYRKSDLMDFSTINGFGTKLFNLIPVKSTQSSGEETNVVIATKFYCVFWLPIMPICKLKIQLLKESMLGAPKKFKILEANDVQDKPIFRFLITPLAVVFILAMILLSVSMLVSQFL